MYFFFNSNLKLNTQQSQMNQLKRKIDTDTDTELSSQPLAKKQKIVDGYYVVVTNMRLDDNEECVLLVKNSILTSLDPLLELLSESNFFSDYEPLEKDDLKELINESEAIKNYFDEKVKKPKPVDLNKSSGDQEEEEEQSENDDDDDSDEELEISATELWFQLIDFYTKKGEIHSLLRAKLNLEATILGAKHLLFIE